MNGFINVIYKYIHKFWYVQRSLLFRMPFFIYNIPYFSLILLGLFLNGVKQFFFSGKLKLIVVTNATVGGNGKSPTVIHLANQMARKNLRVAVLASSYKSRKRHRILHVTATISSLECGDEALMIASNAAADVYVGDNVFDVYKAICEMQKYDVCISDGGLSHLYYLAQNIFWLSDAMVKHNKLAVPFGPLKYPMWLENFGVKVFKGGVSEADLGFNNHDAELLATVVGVCVEDYSRKCIMTAIAKPESVVRVVTSLGINASLKSFMDHSYFDLPNFRNDTAIIVTEKDWARLNFISRKDIFVVKLSYKPNKSFITLVDGLA